MRKYVHLHTVLFVMSLLFAFVLLIVGGTASIIELDARISSLDFMLMGQKVAFQNQMLFFQSKSLFGVVQTLIGQSKPDAIVVGSLIFLFVIVLPVLRIAARGVHIVSSNSFADNKIIRYLAFESGKWDMADVMVVGVLMTYTGLNGILKSQSFRFKHAHWIFKYHNRKQYLAAARVHYIRGLCHICSAIILYS